jgi:hypothetical protein
VGVSAGTVVKGLVLLGVAAGLAIMKWRARARLDALEQSGGCVSCSSTNVVMQGGIRFCQDCGYQGRADGGGKIGAELDHIYSQKPTEAERDLG